MGAREVYHKTKKTQDLAWNTYVCRPIAAVFVDRVKDTRLTPNQITLLSFGVAMLSALLLLALPGYLGLVAAVLVFELSYVLDCADGMLARLRGTASPSGHLLDFLMDEIKAFFVLGASAVRLYREGNDPHFLLLGILGLVCLASGIAMTTFQRRPEIQSALAGGGAAAGALSTEPRTAAPQSGPPPSTEPAIGVKTEGQGNLAGGDGRGDLVSRVKALPMSLAKLLVHYPSYIWLVAGLGHLEWYLYPYVLVNFAYMLKSLSWLALRFGLR